jgi:hypothetical protein
VLAVEIASPAAQMQRQLKLDFLRRILFADDRPENVFLGQREFADPGVFEFVPFGTLCGIDSQ